MNWPDFTKRSNAIVILLGLDVFFFSATFASYMMHNAPKDLQSLCSGAFGGISSALLLALQMEKSNAGSAVVTPQTETQSEVKDGRAK